MKPFHLSVSFGMYEKWSSSTSVFFLYRICISTKASLFQSVSNKEDTGEPTDRTTLWQFNIAKENPHDWYGNHLYGPFFMTMLNYRRVGRRKQRSQNQHSRGGGPPAREWRDNTGFTVRVVGCGSIKTEHMGCSQMENTTSWAVGHLLPRIFFDMCHGQQLDEHGLMSTPDS